MSTVTETEPPRLLSFVEQDEAFHFFRYILDLSEVQDRPEPAPGLRPGDLRRGQHGAFWIFDGETWVEW